MAIASRVLLSGKPSDPVLPWRVLQASSIAAIAVTAFGMLFDLFEIVAPGAFFDVLESPELLNVYLWLRPIGWFAFLLSFAALLWITHDLARNLHMLARGAFTTSPTLAMAWYLAPIANLFMPPHIVDRVARTTSAAAGVAYESRAPGWWWALAVVAGVLGNIAFVWLANAAPLDSFDGDYEAAMWTSIVASALGIVAYLLTLRVFAPIVWLQSGLVRAQPKTP